jgi:hypothetical protein
MDSDALALQTEAKELLARRAYDQIEQRAQELRVSRATFPDGYWRLGAFFCGLSMAVPGSWASDSAQEAHIGLLRNWVREKTNSVIARSALARSLWESIYRESTISWDRVKRGFEALLKRHPQSLDVASEFCYQACKAGGPGHGAPAVRARGQRPGGAPDLAHTGEF